MNSPFWNLHERNVAPTEAEMSLLFTPQDLKDLPVDELNRRIVGAFQYDDFAWQKERGIRTPYSGRAEGLHKVLYGELRADEGETEFSHIPDWYEWERENVRREVEAGSYSSGVLPVRVDSLPNARRFLRLGEGTMVHDMNGFAVRGITPEGEPFEMIKTVPSLYSCHIEYEYLIRVSGQIRRLRGSEHAGGHLVHLSA